MQRVDASAKTRMRGSLFHGVLTCAPATRFACEQALFRLKEEVRLLRLLRAIRAVRLTTEDREPLGQPCCDASSAGSSVLCLGSRTLTRARALVVTRARSRNVPDLTESLVGGGPDALAMSTSEDWLGRGFPVEAHVRQHRVPRVLQDSDVRVALVAAACLLLEAVIAKNVLDVQLDALSQLAALWIWIAYTLAGRRDRLAELGAMSACVVATAAVLVLYAI